MMPDSPHRALVVAVVSGKGGTGKSTLAVNLAVTFAAEGRAVALFDADPCQSSCATLLNEAPSASVEAVARGAVATDRVFHASSAGPTLVVGGTSGGLDGPADALFAAFDDVLVEALPRYDVVLIDAPAGLDAPVRWALGRADTSLLVVVGEPTAVTGAYSLAKAVWQANPSYPLLAVVNAADTDAEAAQVADRFGALTAQFLGQSPVPLGYVPYDAHVRGAARDQVAAVYRSAPLRAALAGLSGALAPLLPARA